MPKKFQLVYAAVLTLVATDDIMTRFRAYKASRLYLSAAEAYEETEQNHIAQIEYLCRLIDKHDVPHDEFDIIALKYYAD